LFLSTGKRLHKALLLGTFKGIKLNFKRRDRVAFHASESFDSESIHPTYSPSLLIEFGSYALRHGSLRISRDHLVVCGNQIPTGLGTSRQVQSSFAWPAHARLPEWTPEWDQSEALEVLVENERTPIVAALLTAFGGVSGLYSAL
jgi:hypothetical protein